MLKKHTRILLMMGTKEEEMPYKPINQIESWGPQIRRKKIDQLHRLKLNGLPSLLVEKCMLSVSLVPL